MIERYTLPEMGALWSEQNKFRKWLDVVDAANALLLRDACGLLLAKTDALLEVLRRRAFEFRDTPQVGRTHGVHAEPTSFGLTFALWYDETRRNRTRIERAREAVAVGKISGAVGAFAHLDPEVEERVCERLGLRAAPVSTQIIQRDVYAEYLTTAAIVASSLDKFALQIRHWQRTEVREAEERFRAGQKGSSAMPHKRNPILSERICGMARLVRGYAVAGLESVALSHERDISHSSAERVTLPDATILLDYAQALALRVVTGMTVHADRMLANLEATHGALYSQRALLALVQSGMARDEAYRVVQENAQRAWDTGTHFRDLLAEAAPQLDLDAVFDAGAFVRHAGQIVARLDRIG